MTPEQILDRYRADWRAVCNALNTSPDTPINTILLKIKRLQEMGHNHEPSAAPELLEACQDAANQLRTVSGLLNHIPKRYAARISSTIRYGDIDSVIAKARGEK